MAGSLEKSEKKAEVSKGAKLIASDKDLPGENPKHSESQAVASKKGVPMGFSEAVVEQFVKESLNSAMTQYAAKGEVKSIVYMQPSTKEESLQMIGIEKGFDSPQVTFPFRCPFRASHMPHFETISAAQIADGFDKRHDAGERGLLYFPPYLLRRP